MLHTPRSQHGSAAPDFVPQPMTEDLTKRAFLCKVEGCGRTLIGVFQFATHEKYFHKLAASERASQCFMHCCPIAHCTMEYVRQEDLQTHIMHVHPTALPSSRPTAFLKARSPSPECEGSPSEEPSTNILTSGSNSSSLSPSLWAAAVETSEGPGHQHIEKQLPNVSGTPGQGSFNGGPGGKQTDKRPAKVQLKPQHPMLPCPHVYCTSSFTNQSQLDKHIAKRHKRGVRFHVVPGVAALEPPFASHDQTSLEPRTPALAATPKSGEPAITVPPQTAPDVHAQGRGRVKSEGSLTEVSLAGTTQAQNNPSTVGNSTTYAPVLNQGSQQCANQTAQKGAPSYVCPFPNCGQVFRRARKRDRHLSQTHFSSPASALVQGLVLTGPGPLLPKGCAAGETPHEKPSPAASVLGLGDRKGLQVYDGIPTQRFQLRDALTCPVHDCSEVFLSLKDLLDHGRDLHGLLDISDFLPALSAAATRPVMTPDGTGPARPGQDPQLATVAEPNPIKTAPMAAKLMVPPMALGSVGSGTLNQSSLGPKNMRCLYPGCSSTFTRATDFRCHEKKIHGLPKSAQCAKMYKVHCHSCQKSYWTQESLDRHILEKHSIPVSQSQEPISVWHAHAQTCTAPVLPPKGPRAMADAQRWSFRCELCRLDFPTAGNLDYHRANSSYHRSILAATVRLPLRTKGSGS